MADWQPIDIPHSSAVTTGRRVRFTEHYHWGWNATLVVLGVLLVLGALGWEILHVLQGHLFDDATIRTTEIGGPLGLVAIWAGIRLAHAKSFISERTVVAPCPACGREAWWSIDGTTERCSSCARYMRVAQDASVQEVGLDDASGFAIWGHSAEARLLVDGRFAAVMPAICAVCGTQPSTMAKIKADGILRERQTDLADEVRQAAVSPYSKIGSSGLYKEAPSHYKTADARVQRSYDALAALEIPVCAQHADKRPVSVDAYDSSDDDAGSSWNLGFDSYRYYRAFMIVNGLPKKA